MNAKEELVDMLVTEGYDMLTAHEIATKYIKEVLERGPGTYTYHTDSQSITLRVKEFK